MPQEPNKSNIVLIIIAVIGVCGTVIGATITVMGNINVEKIRQETELTRIALVSIATQGGATQSALQSTVNAPPQVVEVTREILVTPALSFTSTPEQATIPVDFEGRTTTENVIFNVTKIELTKQSKMRWYISFWNKTQKDLPIYLELANCAYISNRDDGSRYPIDDTNYKIGNAVTIQPQTRLDLWFEAEDAISKGARNFTIGLCPSPNVYAAIYFNPFDINITH